MCDLWPWKSEDRAAHSNYFDPFASKVHKNMHLQLKIENKEKYSIAIQSLHIYMYALHLQSLTRGEKKIRVYDCRGDTLQGLMRLRKFH